MPWDVPWLLLCPSPSLLVSPLACLLPCCSCRPFSWTLAAAAFSLSFCLLSPPKPPPQLPPLLRSLGRHRFPRRLPLQPLPRIPPLPVLLPRPLTFACACAFSYCPVGGFKRTPAEVRANAFFVAERTRVARLASYRGWSGICMDLNVWYSRRFVSNSA